ncbi:MAG: hypothetical protein ACREUA_09275 [Burkholderiales bacterium]
MPCRHPYQLYPARYWIAPDRTIWRTGSSGDDTSITSDCVGKIYYHYVILASQHLKESEQVKRYLAVVDTQFVAEWLMRNFD